ncbi:aldo/keto reductase [Pseudomonas sp. PCH446]
MIHQPAYNLLNRWVEKDLLDTVEELGSGVIAFTPLAQGLLTDKYLNGVRRMHGSIVRRRFVAGVALVRGEYRPCAGLNEIARRRGQSLAQLALAWTLRDPRVTSALIGASRPEQIIENVGALKNLSFTQEELAEIDRFAQEGGSICGRSRRRRSDACVESIPVGSGCRRWRPDRQHKSQGPFAGKLRSHSVQVVRKSCVRPKTCGSRLAAVAAGQTMHGSLA